jgi:uncharacterized protein (DUF58 family)
VSLRERWSALLVRWRPPRPIKITRVGRTYLVLTLGVGGATLKTGNNMLYLVAGLLLAMIVVSSILSERCLRSLSVHRLGTDAAYAGEPAAYRFRVVSTRSPSFALSVTEEDAHLEGAAEIPELVPGVPVVARASLVAPRRGVYRLKEIRITTTYPFGLFAKSRLFDAEGTLLVYPSRRPPAGQTRMLPTGRGEVGSPGRGEGSGDVYGMTDFKPGDDARRIHWLKSAAAGTLLRTQREREERRSAILQLDPTGTPERLDAACEEVAAQASALLDQGFEVGLEAGATRLRPAAGPAQSRRILGALARVGFE